MKPRHPAIPLLNLIARFFGWWSETLEEAERRLKHGPDCGDNRNYGKRCDEKRREGSGEEIAGHHATVTDRYDVELAREALAESDERIPWDKLKRKLGVNGPAH
jgi:hypothetical protein